MPYEPFPSEPQPSLASGTGSAIQTATDPEGNKWQFDDNKGNWVNLNTGEAVSPKVFAQMAGRTGDAARDTLALAQAMRQEEAALTSPRMRPRPVSPVPQTQMAPPAVAPVTATAPMGTPAPVMRPQDNPVIPPYSPQQVAEVAARKPVPSTQIPVTEGQQQFYRMQQADWLMRNRDMKPVDAMRMAGIATQAMTPYQQAQIGLGRQRLQQQAEIAAARAKGAVTPTGPPSIVKLDDRYSVVQVPGSKAWRLLDSKTNETKAFTPAQAASILTKITKEEQDTGASALSGLKDELTKIVKSGVPGGSVATPKRLRVVGPGGKKGTVPEGTKLPTGWKFSE